METEIIGILDPRYVDMRTDRQRLEDLYRSRPALAIERIEQLESSLTAHIAMYEQLSGICRGAIAGWTRDNASKLASVLREHKKQISARGNLAKKNKAASALNAVKEFVEAEGRRYRFSPTALTAALAQQVKMDTNDIARLGGIANVQLRFPRKNARGDAYSRDTILDKVKEVLKQRR